MDDRNQRAYFEQLVVPHLAAAYNLARWLLRNDHDAEDVVQEACLRAYRSIDGLRGSDARAWILAIVRNACYSLLARNRRRPVALEDETSEIPDTRPDPEMLQLGKVDRAQLRRALEELPEEFREAIILRDIEGLSYKEIGAVAGVPIGTVMSRLSRARRRLEQSLSRRLGGVA